MKHFDKETVKYFSRKRGLMPRPFRPSPTAQPGGQLANWHAARMEMNEIGRKVKENRSKGSYRVSNRETENLESSLSSYWDL
jgi:hypothetical protein